MTNTEARSEIRLTEPTREGNGTSRSWQRTIGGTRYSFTHVLMPSGEQRYTVKRLTDYIGGPSFDCAWKLIHSITFKPQATAWRMVAAGHYTADGMEIRRDPNASPDNRWSLRVPGHKWTAHRLLKSAKTRGARLNAETRAARAAAAMTAPPAALAASQAASPAKGARVLVKSAGGGYVEPAKVVELFGEIVLVRDLSGSYFAVKAQHNALLFREEWVILTEATPDKEVALMRLSTMPSGVATPVAMQQQPEQQAAQADEPATPAPTPVEAIISHYRDTQQWPTASQIVQRGADLDELAQALGRSEVERFEAFTRGVTAYRLPDSDQPIAVNDIVTVDPMRESRQFDVIALDEIDGQLVRVAPRNPIDVDDTPRWVSLAYTHRVPDALVRPVADDEEPECEGHESFDGAHMGEGVYCDGSCLRPNLRARLPHGQTAAERAAARAAHLLDPDQLAPFVVGAMVVRQSQPGMVWRITGHEVRGGVTPDAYALLEQPFTGAKEGAFVRDLRVASIAEGLRATAPISYREALSHMLTAVGFELGTGRDDAFAVHPGSGVEVGVHIGGVRLSYPAEHGGAPDDTFHEAFADVEFGTSYEVIVDLAVGLVARVMREGHAAHNREIADQLREWAGFVPGASAEVWLQRANLAALADQLAPLGTECPAAAYARRTTAVVQGVIVQLMQLGTSGRDKIDTAYLRDMAMNVADLMTTPEPHTPEQVAEHLRDRGTQAVIVADESVTPADVDGLIDTLVKAGWTLAPEPEFVGGKRARYLVPPDGAAALLLGKAQPVPAPGQRSPYVGEGVDGARRSADIDRTEADTHPTGSDEWQRCMDSAARWEEQAEFLLDSALLSDEGDELSPEAEALLAAGGITEPGGGVPLVDTAGYLPCGCHGSDREHQCGPSAPDTFDPSSEV